MSSVDDGAVAEAEAEADDEAAASGVDPCEVHPAVAPSTSTAASTTARPRGAAAAVARDGLCGVDIGDLGRGGVQRIDDRPKRQKPDMWNVPTVPTRRPASGPCATPFHPGQKGAVTRSVQGASGEGSWPTTWSAISRAHVAAGDGALSTWTWRGRALQQEVVDQPAVARAPPARAPRPATARGRPGTIAGTRAARLCANARRDSDRPTSRAPAPALPARHPPEARPGQGVGHVAQVDVAPACTPRARRASTALGPACTPPPTMRVRCTPRNGNRGSGTG